MADVSPHQHQHQHQHHRDGLLILPSECYRGSSPRSASTPGPAAPDSPANSASGRFSASPSVSAAGLLSPSAVAAAAAAAAANCFAPSYHYSPYHHHNPAALGLLSGSFLSVGPYSPYAALAAAAAAAAAGLTTSHQPPLGGMHPSQTFTSSSRLRQTLPSSLQLRDVSRVLPFSVENILKPEFGNRNCPGSTSTEQKPVAASAAAQQVETKPLIKEPTAIKRPAASANLLLPSPPPANKRIKCNQQQQQSCDSSFSTDSTTSNKKKKSTATAPALSPAGVTIKSDPADLSGRNSSCTDSSVDGKDNDNNSDRGSSTELPTDPTKMTDPSKWPAWIFCTRYSDRPSSGPRSRRIKKERKAAAVPEEKRPRTAFTSEQLARLKNEFTENRYLNEKRRQELANELQLHENQIKIWFQNKRAKIKKTTGQKNPLALQLMAQGLYNHSTVPIDEEDEEECYAREQAMKQQQQEQDQQSD